MIVREPKGKRGEELKRKGGGEGKKTTLESKLKKERDEVAGAGVSDSYLC